VIYPENRQGALEEQLKQLIISESLRYGIPSSLTGFIGVSEHTGIVPQVTVAVPNALPAGWDASSLCCPSAPVLREYHDISFDLASYETVLAPPGKVHSIRADTGMKFSNVRQVKRSPDQQAPVLYDVVHAIREINGETVLFENIPVKKDISRLFLNSGQIRTPAMSMFGSSWTAVRLGPGIWMVIGRVRVILGLILPSRRKET